MTQVTPRTSNVEQLETAASSSTTVLLKKSLVVVASASLLTGLGVVPQASAADEQTTSNLVANGSFESGINAWRTNDTATQKLGVTTGFRGQAAVLTTETKRTAALNDVTNTIQSTSAGKVYTVSARVKTETPGVYGELRTRVVGDSGAEVVGESFKLTDTSWTTVSYELKTEKNGESVDLNVLAWSMDPSKNLIIDDVSLEEKLDAGTAEPPEGNAPLLPTDKCDAPVSQERTLFGSSLGLSLGTGETFAQGVSRQDRNFENIEVARVFEPNMPVSWEKRAPYVKGKAVSISFRPAPAEVLAGKHDAALLDWFKNAPSDQEIYWTYYHEPEPQIDAGKFTHATYRAAWKHIAALADQACKPNMHATLVLTGWTANPSSKRDWRDYYAGDSVIDVLGWDPYNDASSVEGPSAYASPESIFGNVIAASKSANKPFAIAETGSRLIPTDPTGAQRAVWLKNVGRYLEDHGAVFVAYWDSIDKGDFRLLDDPSRKAWVSIIDGKY